MDSTKRSSFKFSSCKLILLLNAEKKNLFIKIINFKSIPDNYVACGNEYCSIRNSIKDAFIKDNYEPVFKNHKVDFFLNFYFFIFL